MMSAMGRPEKALDRITAMLQPGEEVVAHTSGSLADPGHSAGTTRGTIAVTNQRILYSGTTGIGGSKTLAYPWGQVTAVLAEKNLLTSHLSVAAAGADSRFIVKYQEAQSLAKAAQEQLHAAQQTTTSAPSAADELAKMASLHEQGILSADEFAAAKARILS